MEIQRTEITKTILKKNKHRRFTNTRHDNSVVLDQRQKNLDGTMEQNS